MLRMLLTKAGNKRGVVLLAFGFLVSFPVIASPFHLIMLGFSIVHLIDSTLHGYHQSHSAESIAPRNDELSINEGAVRSGVVQVIEGINLTYAELDAIPTTPGSQCDTDQASLISDLMGYKATLLGIPSLINTNYLTMNSCIVTEATFCDPAFDIVATFAMAQWWLDGYQSCIDDIHVCMDTFESFLETQANTTKGLEAPMNQWNDDYMAFQTLCNGPIVPPAPICGNGTLEFGEQCDDGNAISGDGCDDMCNIELLPPPPGMPAPICGNFFLEVGEECDDGGVADGDGCSSTCTIEISFPPPPLP